VATGSLSINQFIINWVVFNCLSHYEIRDLDTILAGESILMKRIIAAMVLLCLVSCTKEKTSKSIVGSWGLTQIYSGDTSRIYLLGSELSINFKADGHLDILGPKTGYTFLQDHNRYEIVDEDRVRFYDSTGTNELFARFQVDKTLSLLYELRCPYQETFTRR
jgi:hypothetical protein